MTNLETMEKGMELLSHPAILSSACRTFANYRREDKEEILDNIAKNDSVTLYVNDAIDLYYTRYADNNYGRK